MNPWKLVALVLLVLWALVILFFVALYAVIRLGGWLAERAAVGPWIVANGPRMHSRRPRPAVESVVRVPPPRDRHPRPHHERCRRVDRW